MRVVALARVLCGVLALVFSLYIIWEYSLDERGMESADEHSHEHEEGELELGLLVPFEYGEIVKIEIMSGKGSRYIDLSLVEIGLSEREIIELFLRTKLERLLLTDKEEGELEEYGIGLGSVRIVTVGGKSIEIIIGEITSDSFGRYIYRDEGEKGDLLVVANYHIDNIMRLLVGSSKELK